MNITVEPAGDRGAAFPDSLRRKYAESQFHDFDTWIWLTRDRDQYAFTALELNLTKALARIVGVSHNFAHAGSPFANISSKTPNVLPAENGG